MPKRTRSSKVSPKTQLSAQLLPARWDDPQVREWVILDPQSADAEGAAWDLLASEFDVASRDSFRTAHLQIDIEGTPFVATDDIERIVVSVDVPGEEMNLLDLKFSALLVALDDDIWRVTVEGPEDVGLLQSVLLTRQSTLSIDIDQVSLVEYYRDELRQQTLRHGNESRSRALDSELLSARLAVQVKNLIGLFWSPEDGLSLPDGLWERWRDLNSLPLPIDFVVTSMLIGWSQAGSEGEDERYANRNDAEFLRWLMKDREREVLAFLTEHVAEQADSIRQKMLTLASKEHVAGGRAYEAWAGPKGETAILKKWLKGLLPHLI